MPLPFLSKAGHPLGTPLTFSRPYVFPVDETRELHQSIGLSLGGTAGGSRTIKVLDLGGIEKRLRLRWVRFPKSEAESVRAWLHHSAINGAVTTFTFTDVFGTAFTVRYMDSLFTVSESAYQLVSMELSLRIES